MAVACPCHEEQCGGQVRRHEQQHGGQADVSKPLQLGKQNQLRCFSVWFSIVWGVKNPF